MDWCLVSTGTDTVAACLQSFDTNNRVQDLKEAMRERDEWQARRRDSRSQREHVRDFTRSGCEVSALRVMSKREFRSSVRPSVNKIISTAAMLLRIFFVCWARKAQQLY